jgi:serine/threonine protein phosphatase PrpC
LKFSLVQHSRIGTRAVNQDRVAHWCSPSTLLTVLCDGLGGHLQGEVAAQLAVDHLGEMFAREAQPRLANPGLFLLRAIGGAHELIKQDAKRKGLRDTPRTVIVACVVQDGRACWAHVGDSRLYLIREGRIVVRTRDHSLVQHLVDEGHILEEDISTHPERNRLLQCLGGFQLPKPDPAMNYRLAKDDLLLLCSDGFWGPLTERQLLLALASRPLAQALVELMALAETRAGAQCDNVSVVAVTWGEEALRIDEPPPTVPPRELPLQDFAATDPYFLPLSDMDIDKAIAETKAVLSKTRPRR